MNKRPMLNNILCEILADAYGKGIKNVYFQPPESMKMTYPAIRYSIKNIDTKFAANSIYAKKLCYEIMVIDKNPDSVIPEKLLQLPYCSFDRHYVADNLNHYVFTLYY